MHMDAYFNGIEITSLRELARTDPAMIAAHLEPLSDADQSRWGLLNTALFADGLYLRVTAKVATPLGDPCTSSRPTARTASPTRGSSSTQHPGSSATIIEHYVEQGTTPPLCNSATHIALARDAQIEHYRVFATGAGATHIDSLTVRRKRQPLQAVHHRLGGGLVRTSLEAASTSPALTWIAMRCWWDTKTARRLRQYRHHAPPTPAAGRPRAPLPATPAA
jgi:hypothetical protein